MNTLQQQDRNVLKSVILELMVENKNLFKEIIKEILEENQVISSPEQAQRRKKLETLIKEDFKKYDEVFKSLA